MNQRYDLLAFSLLVFSVVVLVCLAADPKGFVLREWQTLIASLVALGAATMAYNGAMAKVNYDRARELRELSRKRLGLYLRLQFAAAELGRQTRQVEAALGTNFAPGLRRVAVYSIKIDNPVEFDQAWENLDLFPVGVGMLIDYVRQGLTIAHKALATVPDTDVIEVQMLGISSGSPLYVYLVNCTHISEQCYNICSLIDAEIKRMSLD
ncbi:hypothetical protein [Bradyrhizobium sp. Leo170]|uniref:hypothetical protein n=1 Tax=Bradyrhizobium sp. Leo170 TaxID=1571199 RepID=UPI00102E56C7|nr:hypothetical protein [Bradyrhizobium sp. Leo170]TAI63457.1 hypothetical protein CWO89_24110 [Bradyrhizobium sp. Leo170]